MCLVSQVRQKALEAAEAVWMKIFPTAAVLKLTLIQKCSSLFGLWVDPDGHSVASPGGIIFASVRKTPKNLRNILLLRRMSLKEGAELLLKQSPMIEMNRRPSDSSLPTVSTPRTSTPVTNATQQVEASAHGDPPSAQTAGARL